ncbi:MULTISPECIES: acyl-CoA dehydrogenase family protein [unclassified Mycolicibacterium]|uniref:acyl-CoA dehydrogenase family protein n=1 Tax=unclassified Mycolicibacterium TaxID=2636767 RepID=UPI0012DFA2F4|nr:MULTISPECIES: acyl-CoA dehydrogenase family protein [unclassified Mycolicibacterium]MUL85682.1 acyl-CoA dehydrogenase [Mycolicibacterium sp. CBMA 329]MUL91559.1 acyl-CoA dehydrogenase [Mycolicibacterium sp. CBMA 331]MUM02201.1 acyl-CoA dehydrogenase [Mycolicibacterium sp. CBMA 334]MUM28032.1 acyl-CoA dehydrogenase [Mycolicibacterium sp. CBMA 295]MUM41151.1 acyl-CoA dehydrogenase [Mycolicibacterium sp. CBMA 247]
MNEFAEIHDELRSVAADLLAKDTIEWPLLVSAGWIGLDAPEEAGGAGATFAEVAVICEELGRAAANTGYLGGAVLAIGALGAVQAGESRDALLRAVVTGGIRAALALPGGAEPAPFELATTRLGWRIHGRATFVLDAAGAQRLLLPARDADGVAVLVHVAANAPGLTVTGQPVLDETRSLASVTAEGVEVDEDAVWRFAGDPEAGLRALSERAALAVACDSLGVAQAMLDATVSYAGVRQQFGRPIGTFQAVKHACADMLVRISVARQLVNAAIENPGGGAVSVSMAKAYATETAVEVAGKAMQLHGGIGYTWESGVHVYLKRAALNRSLFGSPAEHRAKIAQRYQ